MRSRDPKKEKKVKQKAVELVVKLGFQGFSMQKLAKACNISVATLYIYYKSKDDLIKQIGIEEGMKMTETTLRDFSPDMSFAEGLKKQWENRAAYALNNRKATLCMDVIRHSPQGPAIQEAITSGFRPIMKAFVTRAIEMKELKPVPIEVYWSVAFGPLYTLLKFEHEGKSIGGRPFRFNDEMMYQSLDLVLKALKP